MNDYEKQADDFLTKVNGKIKIKYIKYDRYFPDDKESRYIFRFTISRQIADCKKCTYGPHSGCNCNGNTAFCFNMPRKTVQYSATFGQSLAEGNTIPRSYDILACLTKYDVGTFENFCSEFGYDEDSRKAEKIYKAVLKEWAGVKRVFGDVLDELAEIN